MKASILHKGYPNQGRIQGRGGGGGIWDCECPPSPSFLKEGNRGGKIFHAPQRLTLPLNLIAEYAPPIKAYQEKNFE